MKVGKRALRARNQRLHESRRVFDKVTNLLEIAEENKALNFASSLQYHISIRRNLNNLREWSKSDDNFKPPILAVLTFRHIQLLLIFRLMLKISQKIRSHKG